MNRVATSAKGFVLNLSLKENRIVLEQCGYNSMSKTWDKIHQDHINLETETFFFDNQNPLVNQNDALIFSGLTNNNLKRLICLIFDSTSHFFKFDIQLSLQLSELFCQNNVNSFIKLFARKFFFFSFGTQKNQIDLKIYHNFSSKLESLIYPVKTEFSFDQVRILDWTSIEPSTDDESIDYLNFKLLTTVSFENKNKQFLLNYLIEPFGGVLILNNEKMMAQYEQFINRDISLLEEEQNFLFINKNFSKQPLKVMSLCLADFQLRHFQSTLAIEGKIFLNIIHDDKSFIIGLNNGNKFLTKKLARPISNINYYQIDDNEYLILNDEKSFYQIISLSDFKIVYESEQTLGVLVDYFLEDSNHFLIINETNGDFILKKNFASSQNFDLTMRSDSTHDFSMDLSASFNQVEAKNENYVADLVRVLEYKDRMSDLLKEDLVGQIRQKLALISEISNMFSQNSNFESALPKLVDLYSKDLKQVQTSTKKMSAELCSQWSCFLNQKLLLNLIVKASCDINELICAVLIKNSSFEQTTLNNECKQFSMKLDSDLIKILDQGQFEQENFLTIEQTDSISNIFLITLELSESIVAKLIENFEFEATILINFNQENNFFRQYFPIKFNLTDNLIINKNNFNSLIYLSVLNYYESSLTRSVVKLKIYGIEYNLFTKLVTEELNFENILKFDSKFIFYLNKQSLIMDCFLIASFSNDHLKLTVYAR